MNDDNDIKEVSTTNVPKKGIDEKVGMWTGKVDFEDQVTRTLYAILKESRKTNKLLSKLIDEPEPDNRSLKDKALDLLDDGKVNKSNVKKSSKKRDRK